MPLVFVQRYVVPSGGLVTGTGVQYVGTLTLPASGNVYVEFDATLWSSAQAGVEYPLFTYTPPLGGSVSTLTPVIDPGLPFSTATFRDNGSGTIFVTFVS